MKQILIIDDDEKLGKLLVQYLERYDMKAHVAITPSKGLEMIKQIKPDLLILDVMLPEKDGFEICREIRAKSSIFGQLPILMLTAKGEEMDKVVGLNAGADDYVTKPFGLNELLARIRALLRRTCDWAEEANGQPVSAPSVELDIGKAKVDCRNYEITIDGEVNSLTPRELELIRFLVQHRGNVLSRDEILEKVWGVKYFGTTRTLDQCVAQIRKKIGDHGRTPEYLLTVHGVGYKLA